MDIEKFSNRKELKGYFKKNGLPTEENFAELIDGMINQYDDGLVKLPGDPLSIKAVGDDNSPKEVLNFYNDFKTDNPEWTINLNPQSDSNESGTAPGFNISDGEGNSRLFIDRTTGHLGVNTTSPQATLDIHGDTTIRDASGNKKFHFDTISGNIIQEDWQPVNFNKNWRNFDSKHNNASYFKDSMGIVHLRGIVKGGLLDGKTPFKLKDNYRPAKEEIHVVYIQTGAPLAKGGYSDNKKFVLGQVVVKANGEVSLSLEQENSIYASIVVGLDGISFMAKS